MTIAAPYRNSGNELVISMIPAGVNRVLDIGCGAGDNARRLKAERPSIEVVGVTHNEVEAALAAPFMSSVHVFDIERDVPAELGGAFDLLLFSHVLEHVRDPISVISRFLPELDDRGYILVAVPNTLEWRTRFAFLKGRFVYAEHGILDRTHVRFYTYETAAAELIEPLPAFTLVARRGRGGAPLGPFRHWLLSERLKSKIDEFAVRRMPNLFSGEVALLAQHSR
jgi:2-polyprenyl-3-methyl-5-hydroxy-6-metoxy-1,4-benzoquinol methylase